MRRVGIKWSPSEDVMTGESRGFLDSGTKDWYQTAVARYRTAAAKAVQRAGYHDAMREKYEHAVSRPWLSVELDPPPPGWP
jgi:hypothetical protein